MTKPPTTRARIQICSVSNPAICDTSDTDFTIGGHITVSISNGGEVWPIGSTRTIRWTSSGIVGKVKIELSRNGGSGWTTLFSGTANDGAQSWKVKGPATTQARIRITSVNDAGATDTSDANFTIQ